MVVKEVWEGDYRNLRIDYNRIVQSVAVRKSPRQSGLMLSLDYTDGDNVVRIESINPRLNEVTSLLSMEIPYESIDEVIEALQTLKKDVENVIS